MLAYFASLDTESFLLWLIIPPLFSILLAVALETRCFVLGSFFSLAFIATAITPAFFFANREDYSFSGFNAIRDFDFDLASFFIAYAHLYIFLLSTLVFSLALRKAIYAKNKKICRGVKLQQFSLARKEAFVKRFKMRGGAFAYSLYCVAFILIFLIPLNMFMYIYGIGIATVEPQPLQFKLVGITFYARNYVAPLVLTYLYAKSDRKAFVTIILVMYAALVGIFSLSKGNIALACMPVLLFCILDKKLGKFVILLICYMFLFGGVAWARQFVFLTEVGSFEMIAMIINDSFSNEFWFHVNPIRVLSEFSNRLFGASVIVLANQYHLENGIAEIVNFFLARTENLDNIIAFDVFGLKPVDGVIMGVSMGYIGTMLLLAGGDVAILTALALVTACYLTLCGYVVDRYLQSPHRFYFAGYGFGFLLVLFFYETHMMRFYSVVALALFGLILMERMTVKKILPLN